MPLEDRDLLLEPADLYLEASFSRTLPRDPRRKPVEVPLHPPEAGGPSSDPALDILEVLASLMEPRRARRA